MSFSKHIKLFVRTKVNKLIYYRKEFKREEGKERKGKGEEGEEEREKIQTVEDKL